jgi:hypothetical protein
MSACRSRDGGAYLDRAIVDVSVNAPHQMRMALVVTGTEAAFKVPATMPHAKVVHLATGRGQLELPTLGE